jgi:hypothetical protein
MNVLIAVPPFELQIDIGHGEWVDVVLRAALIERAYEILAERHTDELESIATKLFKGELE